MPVFIAYFRFLQKQYGSLYIHLHLLHLRILQTIPSGFDLHGTLTAQSGKFLKYLLNNGQSFAAVHLSPLQ